MMSTITNKFPFYLQLNHPLIHPINPYLPNLNLCDLQSAPFKDFNFLCLFIIKLLYTYTVPFFVEFAETEILHVKFLLIGKITLYFLAGLFVFKEKYSFSAMSFFTLKAAQVVYETFPFTINHEILELVILLLILTLMPIRFPKKIFQEKSSSSEKIPSPLILKKLRVNLLGWLFLSVYFYSGIHKLFQGYFIDGEFFALHGLSGNFSLGENLQKIIFYLNLNKHETSLIPVCCNNLTISIPYWESLFYRVLGPFIIVMEILIPFLFLFPITRVIGFFVLLAAQMGIAFFSGELDFGVTCLAIMATLAPRPMIKYLYLNSLIIYAVRIYPYLFGRGV